MKENKNEMMVFNNDAFGNLRGVNINGEGWLAGKDVVEALGYTLSKSHTYSEYLKKYVDEEDMLFLDKNSPLEQGVSFDYKQLGQRGGYLVNKSALYSLVLDSPLPQAKKFRRWVTSEVLPQIEQTGGYIPIKEEDDELTIMSKAFMIAQKTIDNKQQQIEQQQQTINEQQQVIESQRPKADYYDTTLCSNKLITTTDIAKDLGMTAIELNKILVDKKILYKYGKTYYPYAKYNFLVKEKYCDYVISEHSQFLKWTEKGREWIINLVNENDNKSVDIIVE